MTLTDCKSKFGTAVNGKKIGANLKRELCRDYVIRFGQGPTPSRSQFKSVFNENHQCIVATYIPDTIESTLREYFHCVYIYAIQIVHCSYIEEI